MLYVISLRLAACDISISADFAMKRDVIYFYELMMFTSSGRHARRSAKRWLPSARLPH